MLVSRWIKPGSLSKPILDLKGRQMCFRNITITAALLPMGADATYPSNDRPEWLCTAKADTFIATDKFSGSCGKHQWELAAGFSVSLCARERKRSSGLVWFKCLEPPEGPFFPADGWRKMFPDIIRKGKAIDFLATVGMFADGIAYNHYGIKYVLKRLGDQRRGKDSAHIEWERTGRWRDTGERKRKGEGVGR